MRVQFNDLVRFERLYTFIIGRYTIWFTSEKLETINTLSIVIQVVSFWHFGIDSLNS